jgi:hypothetical protein
MVQDLHHSQPNLQEAAQPLPEGLQYVAELAL